MNQIAWLLDDGTMCIGVCETSGYLKLVTYTSSNALKFADKNSAEIFLRALNTLGFTYMTRICIPIEHSWGYM